MRIGEIIVQNRLPIPSPTRIAFKRGASPKGEARRESAAKEERSNDAEGGIRVGVGGRIHKSPPDPAC